jgi:uncharacterized metal-binding protein YceD (DUF177 family)
MYDFDMTFYYEGGQSVGDCTLLTLPLRWVCALRGKGKCVQCAVALEFFRALAIFFVFFP